MFSSFRQTMTWLHTWFGLVLGFVLMVVFFFGSLSVFDREIDRWALPETRFDPQPMPTYDRMLADIFPQVEPEEEELAAARTRVTGQLPDTLQPIGWGAYTTHRDPVLNVFAEFAVPNNPDDPYDHVHGHLTIDPRSGQALPHDQLKIGSEFFYPMHYSLHLHWQNLGIWIVGLAALIMLVALVSGVVMHRRLFRELFTFRAHRGGQRATLDLHNLTGVVALPFHFFFALSGLTIFAALYLPVSETILKPQADAFMMAEAVAKGLPFAPAGEPAAIASVDAMVAEAKRRWAERGMPGDVGLLWVSHPGDRNSYVSIYRAGSDRVALVGQGVHFDASTGKVLHEEPPPSAITATNEFLTGLHLQHFEDWPLRWLYVLGGLAGCICIATGFVFFVEKRKRNLADTALVRWVDALAVTAVTGMLVATTAILVGNRLLPADLDHRGTWEEAMFWIAWLLAFTHASWRGGRKEQGQLSPAWHEQCWAVAVLATFAVLLNWFTTGDHLGKTLSETYWPVAGFDLALLASAALAGFAARALGRRQRLAEPAVSSNPTRMAVPRG